MQLTETLLLMDHRNTPAGDLNDTVVVMHDDSERGFQDREDDLPLWRQDYEKRRCDPSIFHWGINE